MTELSHAAYLGRELEKVELSPVHSFKYVQDGALHPPHRPPGAAQSSREQCSSTLPPRHRTNADFTGGGAGEWVLLVFQSLISDFQKMGDQNLVRGLKAGSASAFKELFDAYSSLVYNVALRMLQDRQDAEDVTQDVFLKAYKSLRHFRGESQVSTWLYRITVNLSLNFQRARKHRQQLFIPKAAEDSDPTEGDHQLSGSGGPTDENPSIKLEERETGRIVQEAINSLPDQQRVASMLYHYEGLSYGEIAKVMDVTVASVESRLHRAKITLAKELLRLRREI